MTGAFDGLGHFTLIFQAGAGQPAGQDFALLVEQFQQEVAVFVINVFDTGFLEAVVFFAVLGFRDGFVLKAHDYLLSAVSVDFFLPTKPFRLRSLYAKACLSSEMVRWRMMRSSRRYSVLSFSIIVPGALNSKS